jgi:hypothetical protein
VKYPNVTVIVATIPPMAPNVIAPNNVERAEMTKQYNALIPQRVLAYSAAGKRVGFADVNSVLAVSDLYDGIHPTKEAHVRIAEVWHQALSDLLPMP